MFGHEFLPSPDWVTGSRPYAVALGALGAGAAYSSVRRFLNAPPTTNRHRIIADLLAGPGFFLSLDKRKKISLALVPLAGFAAGYVSISQLLPMSITFAMGRQTERTYEVDRVEQDEACRYAVYLRGMPFGRNPLCGLPEWFRISLEPGDTLFIKGTGSAVGIFVDTVRVSPK
ncbi:hypothetical protein [Rhizobium sp. RU33A]|uniref:hypothetical protein n=1 Tax=Rhizobium sp. RU33A TaxID=1907413 RepID=UPI0011159B16|nr:hypothetical protein [Rhizobium sp. RU33A]